MAVRAYVRRSPLQHESCSAERVVVSVQQIQVVTRAIGGRSKRLFREALRVCLRWLLAAALKCSACWVTSGTRTPPVSTLKQVSRIRKGTSDSAHVSEEDWEWECTQELPFTCLYQYMASLQWKENNWEDKSSCVTKCFHVVKKKEQFWCLQEAGHLTVDVKRWKGRGLKLWSDCYQKSSQLQWNSPSLSCHVLLALSTPTKKWIRHALPLQHRLIFLELGERLRSHIFIPLH